MGFHFGHNGSLKREVDRSYFAQRSQLHRLLGTFKEARLSRTAARLPCDLVEAAVRFVFTGFAAFLDRPWARKAMP